MAQWPDRVEDSCTVAVHTSTTALQVEITDGVQVRKSFGCREAGWMTQWSLVKASTLPSGRSG